MFILMEVKTRYSTNLKGISEYVMPKPNEKFCVNSSTNKNDTSEKGDIELPNTKAAVHAVEAP